MAEKESDPLSVLNRPIPSVLRKQTYIEKVNKEGTISTEAEIVPDFKEQLQKEPKKESQSVFQYQKVPSLQQNIKQDRVRGRLRILYDSLPPLTADKIPPCSTCKTSICCYAYQVALTKEEYESGFYHPYAIKLTREMLNQIEGFVLVDVTSQKWDPEDTNVYILEGNPGEPCPLLGDDGRCTVYNNRPLVCRSYTCIDDPRIDQEVRDGVKPPMYEKTPFKK